MAMSAGIAHNRNVCCTQNTQAAITTRARGTQCTLMFLISTSSQTEEEFPGAAIPGRVGSSGRSGGPVQVPASGLLSNFSFGRPGTHGQDCEQLPVHFLETVLEVYNTHAGASQKFPASRDGAHIAAKAGPHMCTCSSHVSNTGDTEEMRIGGGLYSCLSCQQHNRPATHVNVCTSKMAYSCALCKKSFP